MTRVQPDHQPSTAWAWLLFVLTMLTLIPVGFGVMIALGAGEPPWRPYAWRVWVVVGVCSLAGIGAVTAAIGRVLGKPLAFGGAGPLICGLLAAGCPVLARVVLPWEEPGSGMGSPLAVLLGLSCMALPAAAYLAFAMVVVGHLRGSSRTDADRVAPGP